MMQISNVLFMVLMMGSLIVGTIIGFTSVHDYKKALEKEYKKAHDELYDKIHKETKGEWSAGWDAAYQSYAQRQKAYFLWFREHGYELEDIEKWLEKYMKNG